MQADIRAALVLMCRQVLYPLVRILIRFGVSAGEFKAILDTVYARAGSEYLASQGQSVSYSKLAIITGINRSVLPSILSAPDDEFRPRSTTQLHRAARVLAGWWDDPRFQTRSGAPSVLRISGGPRSFEELVRRYSGGVYYRTLLGELLRVGAVKRVGASSVRALRRTPTAGGASADALLAAGEIAGDLLATLEHNLAAKPHEHLPVRSLAVEVDGQTLPVFRAQLAKRADGMLEMTEAFLQAHRPGRGKKPAARSQGSRVVLGAAVFAICRRSTDAVALPPVRRGRKPRG